MNTVPKVFAEDRQILKSFLSTAAELSRMPHLKRRRAEESRSLFEAVAEPIDAQATERILTEFFGPAFSPAGDKPGFFKRRRPALRLLGGVNPEQVFYSRVFGKGEFYAAIWPWHSNPDCCTLHLGFCDLTDEDAELLQAMINDTCS